MQKLPSRWKMARLGEVADYLNGKAFKPSDWSNSGIPIIRIQNLTDKTKHFNFYQGECEPKYHVNNGDILISWSASLGVFVWEQGLAYLNQHIFKAVPKLEIIDKSYFVYAISTTIEKMKRKVHGATMTHIVKSDFNKIQIPFPPLPTQHKIVEIIEEADNLKKLRQQADEKMKDLVPSIFVHIFGDPATNPKGWKVRTIGDVCSKNTGIRNPSDFVNGYFQYVDISSIDNITGVITTARTILNIDAPSRARKVIKSNDVLVSTVRPNLNAVAVVPNELDDQICSTGFCVLRVSSETSNHHYIYAITRSKYFVESLTKKTQGASYPAISDKDIFNFTIPLPPLPLQQEFAELVEGIEEEKARQAESRKKLDELFNSLMQRAFTGELVS